MTEDDLITALNETEADRVIWKTAAMRIIEMHEANKPKPEPVAYTTRKDLVLLERGYEMSAWSERGAVSDEVALYLAPPTREPLSEEQINALRIEVSKEHAVSRWLFHLIIRLTERVHGIGA